MKDGVSHAGGTVTMRVGITNMRNITNTGIIKGMEYVMSLVPTNLGPFDLEVTAGNIVGRVEVLPDTGAMLYVNNSGPFGREDLRKIAHRLMNIADFDTGLQE
jgi:hypothetical protein